MWLVDITFAGESVLQQAQLTENADMIRGLNAALARQATLLEHKGQLSVTLAYKSPYVKLHTFIFLA